MNQGEVRFIRKNGRIIPIGTKKAAHGRSKRIERTAHDAGAAIGSGFTAGGAAYYGLTKQEKKFRKTASRFQRLIDRGLSRKLPTPRLKQPTIFELNDWNKENKVFLKGKEWARRFKPEKNAALKTANYIARHKGKAALAVGAIAALGSLGASFALRDK